MSMAETAQEDIGHTESPAGKKWKGKAFRGLVSNVL
jgi:hypothetical protein